MLEPVLPSPALVPLPAFSLPVRELVTKVRAGFAPPVRLTVSEFSDQHIIVTSGPLSGTHWRTAFAPYQRGILDAFHEDGVQVVVVMGSSQWGKTACAVNVVAYHMVHDPCPILVVEPTVDPMARDFSTNRLEPQIEASPALKEVVGKKRGRNASNTQLSKTYRGGSLAIGGANSAASLAARTIRLLVLDEIERYPAELPGEGATLSVVMKRTLAYRSRRRILMLSSPTLEGGPIHYWHSKGDQRRYYVPCPSCEHMFAFEWKHVKWVEDDPATARIECPSCEYGITDAERVAMLSGGEWRAEKPGRRDRSIVSFHLWEAYSPLSSLSEIVSNFISAKEKQNAGDKAEMHTWSNTTLGEPVEVEGGVGIEPNSLLLRRESVPIDPATGVTRYDVPAGVCCLTAGVDTQDDRLEVLVIGWGPGEESWLVDRRILHGDPDGPEPWQALDVMLDLQYRHASGQRLMIHSACLDTAGHRTTAAYNYAEKMQVRNVHAAIGRAGQRPIVSSPSPKRWGNDERQVPLYTIGVDAAKSVVVSRLKLTEKGPGYVHIPHHDWADAELMAQLASEKLVTKFVKGLKIQVWRKTRTRNEMLDCAVLALAALRLLNPKLPQMLEELNRLAAVAATLEPEGAANVPTTPKPPPAPYGRRRSESSYLK